MRQKLALIITLVLTALFLKNIIANAMLWRDVTPPDRDTLLQF